MDQYDIGRVPFPLHILHSIKLGHGFQHLQENIKVRVQGQGYMEYKFQSEIPMRYGKI